MAELHKNQIRLIGDQVAFLVVPYPLSKENFEHIKDWLDLMEKVLVVVTSDQESAKGDT